jgi:type II secretory ATPase GspE/PulE/Tfp pilus assembly ATPase PilB-like protein/RNA polymerase subunit RPABC4/transcription elongation factor Spt4
MIGEIRDQETAEIALQSSLTGHLVFSTLHTNDAPSAITRLSDIGMPEYLIASSVIGIIAQRLVRKICPDCKEEFSPAPEQLLRLGLTKMDKPRKFFQGSGCQTCGSLGFKGRTVVEEVMIMGRKIRELVQANTSADLIREAAIAAGMQTLADSALKKLELGITAVDEVLKAIQQKEQLTSRCPNCGKNVNPNSPECPYCKKPLIKSCPSCGRILQPDWLTCPYCRTYYHVKP